jgi:hypothetical protein
MNELVEIEFEIVRLALYVYAYCTDLIINLANLFNLSYYEINFVMFCVIYPLAFFGSLALYVVQYLRLYRIQKK